MTLIVETLALAFHTRRHATLHINLFFNGKKSSFREKLFLFLIFFFYFGKYLYLELEYEAK